MAPCQCHSPPPRDPWSATTEMPIIGTRQHFLLVLSTSRLNKLEIKATSIVKIAESTANDGAIPRGGKKNLFPRQLASTRWITTRRSSRDITVPTRVSDLGLYLAPGGGEVGFEQYDSRGLLPLVSIVSTVCCYWLPSAIRFGRHRYYVMQSAYGLVLKRSAKKVADTKKQVDQADAGWVIADVLHCRHVLQVQNNQLANKTIEIKNRSPKTVDWQRGLGEDNSCCETKIATHRTKKAMRRAENEEPNCGRSFEGSNSADRTSTPNS